MMSDHKLSNLEAKGQVNKARQRKTNTGWYHFYMESKQTNKVELIQSENREPLCYQDLGGW